MKPLGAQLIIKLFDYLNFRPDIIRNGFKDAGIVDCLNDICLFITTLNINH